MLNNVLTRYFMVVQYADDHADHEDLGTEEAAARLRLSNFVDSLIAKGYVAAQYPGAPVWKITMRACSTAFIVGLYEKADDGEYGGSTDPMDSGCWEQMPLDSGSVNTLYWN